MHEVQLQNEAAFYLHAYLKLSSHTYNLYVYSHETVIP